MCEDTRDPVIRLRFAAGGCSWCACVEGIGIKLKLRKVFRSRWKPALRGNTKGKLVAATASVALLAALTGCTADTNSAEEPDDVKLSASVTDGESEVEVAEPILVEVNENGLDSVTLTNDEGKEVEGKFSEERRVWNTTEPLGYNRSYTLKASSGDESINYTFTTTSPSMLTQGYASPADGAVVGIGQTIAVRFDESIQDRQAAEDAITVTAEPAVEGAFYWLNNREVRWRPENFWEPGTKVHVDVDIYGKDLGGGYYGQSDTEFDFTIGDKVVAYVDDATKTMTVERNDQVEYSMPVSLGTPRWATPNGTYIIGEQRENMVMDSTTYGLSLDAGGYRTPVNYATQMSYSGIYVHGAPWSVWAQGSQNTSHGCINVSDANAKLFQQATKRGDVVIVKNTVGETLSGLDGLGDWNIPWETWKKGNADQTSSW